MGAALAGRTMDGAPLFSHTHYYWYEVGMWKVLSIQSIILSPHEYINCQFLDAVFYTSKYLHFCIRQKKILKANHNLHKRVK